MQCIYIQLGIHIPLANKSLAANKLKCNNIRIGPYMGPISDNLLIISFFVSFWNFSHKDLVLIINCFLQSFFVKGKKLPTSGHIIQICTIYNRRFYQNTCQAFRGHFFHCLIKYIHYLSSLKLFIVSCVPLISVPIPSKDTLTPSV